MVVLPLSWLLQPRPRRWRPFIVAASFVFYAGWDWRFCFLLAFSILWNHVLATAIHRRSSPRARKQLLVIALIGNVGLLGYFKYYDFFVTSTNNLFALVGVDRAPGRDLLLHVHGDRLRRRRLPRRLRAGPARPVRRLPLVLPASGRRS